MALPPVPCTNCGGPVAQRRRSASGRHYCTEAKCQRAKSRANYRKRGDQQLAEAKNLLLLFVHAIATVDRVPCPECGLVNALPGYKHPRPDGLACNAIGEMRMGSLAPELADAVWPLEARDYGAFV